MAEQNEMDKILTPMLEYVCDKLCIYPVKCNEYGGLQYFCGNCELYKYAEKISEQYNLINDFQGSQRWIPVSEKLPETYIYDRLWLTIQYPSGHCRTIEGRYKRYENVFLHVNQKPIKEKVAAWKEYRHPSPFNQ